MSLKKKRRRTIKVLTDLTCKKRSRMSEAERTITSTAASSGSHDCFVIYVAGIRRRAVKIQSKAVFSSFIPSVDYSRLRLYHPSRRLRPPWFFIFLTEIKTQTHKQREVRKRRKKNDADRFDHQS